MFNSYYNEKIKMNALNEENQQVMKSINVLTIKNKN